jgi:hypothetical protein
VWDLMMVEDELGTLTRAAAEEDREAARKTKEARARTIAEMDCGDSAQAQLEEVLEGRAT